MTAAIISTALLVSGGIITAGVQAEEPETITEEITEPATPGEIASEETGAEEEPKANEPEETTGAEEPGTEETTGANEKPQTVEQIIASQTGLVIDKAKRFDHYKKWSAYEVFADGDIYVVTMQGEKVDIVTQLN